MLSSRLRSAFTLIEVCVCLAIVATLLALLLPAVQKVRAAAYRVTCLNNLKQIGIACHHYHHDHGTLPPGGIEWRPPGNTTNRQLAWSAFLLPYLEQDGVYRRVDLQQPFDSPANAPAAAQVIKVYLCPNSRRMEPTVEGRGAIDYGGIYGERITGPNQPPKGVMIYDHAYALADIYDGTSYTLMISEDSGFPDGQWINGRNIFDQAFPINKAPPWENDIRSDHGSGANGLFADGSARFLKETMPLRILAAICTRARDEPVVDDDF